MSERGEIKPALLRLNCRRSRTSVTGHLWQVMLLGMAWCLSAGTPSSQAQEEAENGPGEPGWACQLLPQPEQLWDFGLVITASGETQGLSAAFPLPVDWPEQSLRAVGQIVEPDHVQFAIQNDRDLVRRARVTIPGLWAEQQVRVVVRVAVIRSWQMPPEDTGSLKFDRSPPKDVKPWLLPSPYIESRQKQIVELARSLPVDPESPAWNQVESIYDWVREQIEYRFDEQIHSLADCLKTRTGDCEEMSSLFIALCRARNIPARAVWVPGHTYPEFWLVDPNGQGHWYPCQLAGSREFGGMSESRPILAKGDRFRVPGSREDLRYPQTTLSAEHAVSPPSLQSITGRVDGAADSNR